MNLLDAGITVATLALLCACSSTSTPAPTPTPVTATTTEDPTVASSAEASMSAAAASQRREIDNAVRAVQADVDKAMSLDDRLSPIVTAYCRKRLPDGLNASDSLLVALSDMYEKAWRAGGKWNRPIEAAAQQQGACPTPAPTTPKSPVG